MCNIYFAVVNHTTYWEAKSTKNALTTLRSLDKSHAVTSALKTSIEWVPISLYSVMANVKFKWFDENLEFNESSDVANF